MTTADILNLVELRNNIVAQIKTFIEESDIEPHQVYDVLDEITEKINEIAPVWFAKNETTVTTFSTNWM